VGALHSGFNGLVQNPSVRSEMEDMKSNLTASIAPANRCFLTAIILAVVSVVPLAAQSGGGSATRAVQLPLSGRQSGEVTVHQSAPIPSGSSANIQIQLPGAFAGSIPATEALPAVFDLTLDEAVRRGLQANLGIVNSSLALQSSTAQRSEARSALLPNVSASVSENAAKLNLAAEGFSASAFGDPSLQFPASVGPYHYYDLHGALQQSLLDITAIRNLRSQEQLLQAQTFQSRQAREEVVLAVTGVYLQLMADVALGDLQTAEVAYAEATYKQAQSQADAGNKAPIEASRSLVQLQREQQRLRSQQGEIEKRRIQLARLIGLGPGTHIVPKEKFAALSPEASSVMQLVEQAWSQRLDLKGAEAQLRAAEEARKAASAQRLPSVSLNGTYGLQGVNPNQGVPVFQATASLSVPLFQGGRIQAETAQADTVVKQRRAELADQRGVVESEVRTALIDLQVANDQVVLAASNRKLATQTLEQSQDRFAVGVADSVEVVDSQELLAAADHDYVNGLFSQYIAKITLAHAMGEAEKDLSELLERKVQ
jgi:outer membrane protein TolC